MKKHRSKPKSRDKTRKASLPNDAKQNEVSRRWVVSRGGKVLIGLGVLGGGAAFAVNAVNATVKEQDVSRVGTGVPTVVQIHDPGCALCSALQKETRKALQGFDPDQLDYVVANIKTDEGSAFAARFGQPHVTLMLMDPEGRAVRVLNGPQHRDDLRALFERHAAAYR
jgi:thioredoxin-like negative regulator of GroEL